MMSPAIDLGAATRTTDAPLPFDLLYAAHAAGVHRFCVSQLGDTTAAEDITHDTFVRAYMAYERARPEAATVRTWLLSIARNLVADDYRRRSRWRRWLAWQRQEAPAAPDVEVVATNRARLREVAAAMQGLRRRDRELIGLRIAADLSLREVAHVLGMSEAAAKVAAQRALQRLRQRLDADPEAQGEKS